MSDLAKRIAALPPEQREALLRTLKVRTELAQEPAGPIVELEALQLRAATAPLEAKNVGRPLVAESQSCKDHLAQLPQTDWAVWRWVGLRGAGFPIVHLLDLAAPESARLADRLLELEAVADQARNEAVTALKQELEQASGQERVGLMKRLRRIRQASSVALQQSKPDPEMPATWRVAQDHVRLAWETFQRTFQTESAQISKTIRRFAGQDRFREAVAWQNRRALHGSIDALLRTAPQGDVRNAESRKREALVASYMQRYCAKNDTIGFFGPVGWARFVTPGEAVAVRAGPELLATRTVYFEGWCIDALAAALSSSNALRPWIAPRRMPFIHVDGLNLRLPMAPPLALSARQAAVLQACDGVHMACELAHDLVIDPSTELRTEQEVYAVLEELQNARRIAWTLEVAFEGERPEWNLRQLLERIGDAPLRQTAISSLDELERARERVTRATGDVEALDRALGDLEATFTRLTNLDATRHAGKVYAARTIVYEDCRRDIEVELGSAFLERLGPPLALLLVSARWFVFQATTRYRAAFQEIYRTLARRAGAQTVDFSDFWLWAQPLAFGENKQLLDALLPIFQKHWSEILALPEAERRVAYTSAELWPRVHARFDAPYPGWQSARYHSPDLMIAASSAEAIRRGDYQLVLGELHLAMNTLKISVFLSQHPAPEELALAVDRDLPTPLILPVLSKQWPAPPARTVAALAAAKDARLVYAHDSCGVSAEQALPISDLLVEETADGLIVRTRDGRRRFDIIEVFAELLAFQAGNYFKILGTRTHTPRITIDHLVICREAWNFTPDELGFAYEEREPNRFAAVRRWASSCGMPRFIFVKTPVEEKPIYIDFASPVFVDMFAKIVRRTAEQGARDAVVTVTEMLPNPNHVWLPDDKGERYTCELRIVALDPLTPVSMH